MKTYIEIKCIHIYTCIDKTSVNPCNPAAGVANLIAFLLSFINFFSYLEESRTIFFPPLKQKEKNKKENGCYG